MENNNLQRSNSTEGSNVTAQIYGSSAVGFDPRVKCQVTRGIYGRPVFQMVLHKYHFSPQDISGGLGNRSQGFLSKQAPIVWKVSVSTVDKAIWFSYQLGRGQD